MPEYDPALPDRLREDLGERTEATIANVLAAAERLAAEWGVRLDGWLPGGTCSLVLTGSWNGTDVVLRAPLLPWEIEASLPTLLAFSGKGGVEVLRADHATGTTLLPRLRPGTNLSALNDDEAIDVIIDLIRRLHGASRDAPSVTDYLRPILTGERRKTTAWMHTDPVALAARLEATSPSPRLLHGDLHHFNVLQDGDTWIAIDPEGMSGDPAYECAAFLRNPIPQVGAHPDLRSLQRHRILRLAKGLELPANRIWGWALIRTTLCVSNAEETPSHPWVRVLGALDNLGEEFL